MRDPSPLAIFDGHNDLVLRLLCEKVTAPEIAAGTESGHIDAPRARAGGFAGGFFAIFTPNPAGTDADFDGMRAARYDLALPPEVPWAAARHWTDRGFDALNALEAAGAIVIARTTADIESGLSGERMVAVPHIEGAEAIDRDFECLHAYYARGLRSLGPVWSRPTIWGHGVPFRFPSSPDTGPGLSEAGKALIRACNDLGIMVDLSHLNEKGFDDVARISTAPLVATHSNAWAVTPHARNLTDRQLAAIRDSEGVVGVNFASAFLRPDGRMEDDFGFDAVLRHFDHLLSVLGEDGVALGSDFDGALVPRPLRDCAGLPRLVEALRGHGFDDALLKRIAHGNWLRLLKRTWRGESA